MSLQILQLDDLSLPGMRVGEPPSPPADLGPRENHMEGQASYPSAGIKVMFDAVNQNAAYVYLFMQEGTRDWLVRLNGQDKYGAIFSAWAGKIYNKKQDCTLEFMRNPKAVLASCPQLRFLRESASEVSFFLAADPLERRIHVEFSATNAVKRIILG